MLSKAASGVTACQRRQGCRGRRDREQASGSEHWRLPLEHRKPAARPDLEDAPIPGRLTLGSTQYQHPPGLRLATPAALTRPWEADRHTW